jgi:hypothetical protein
MNKVFNKKVLAVVAAVLLAVLAGFGVANPEKYKAIVDAIAEVAPEAPAPEVAPVGDVPADAGASVGDAGK